MTARPYRLRFYWPHKDGVSKPWLGQHVRTFSTMGSAEEAACDERIRCRRESDIPGLQPAGYQVVKNGVIEADVMFKVTR
jgi:hypothetical protein